MKTSMRRDCDHVLLTNLNKLGKEGMKTSMRRDCDLLQRAHQHKEYLEGMKTSMRRDCDGFAGTQSLTP